MTRKTYCGTAAKAGGNGENKLHLSVKGVPCLLTKAKGLDAVQTALSVVMQAVGIRTLRAPEKVKPKASRKRK